PAGDPELHGEVDPAVVVHVDFAIEIRVTAIGVHHECVRARHGLPRPDGGRGVAKRNALRLGGGGDADAGEGAGGGDTNVAMDDRDRTVPSNSPSLAQLYDDFVFVGGSAGTT